jgi:hypothetical protein
LKQFTFRVRYYIDVFVADVFGFGCHAVKGGWADYRFHSWIDLLGNQKRLVCALCFSTK